MSSCYEVIQQSNNGGKGHVSSAFGTSRVQSNDSASRGFAVQCSRPNTVDCVIRRDILCREEQVPPFSDMLSYGRVNADFAGSSGVVLPSCLSAKMLTAKAVVEIRLRIHSCAATSFNVELECFATSLVEGNKVPIVLKNMWGEFVHLPRREDVGQLDVSHLEGAPKTNLLTALREFADIFLKKDQKLGCTDRISHSIETADTNSLYVWPYRVPQSQK
ncbi:hypothetical protein PR048_015616 [Dryococelus australis]|uniref:Uncharacterized protein n=1 Tax=Dryococelus australis TaxID=614101 RepID=A0ABQ9HHN3_9NEOP|nr:hypothetical protein PR048_015616 [Dryococelus australis]